MGTALAPDLANDFAFMHELIFLKTMINGYLLDTRNNIEPLYPLEFIEQYRSNTKRFIDDILTVAPGLPSRKGPTFEQIIKREGGEGGVYGGMHPKHILDDEGEQVANPVSITKEQRGQTVHFLDMEILQSTPGVSQIQMYDKQDHIETLKQYRRYLHIETRLSKKCLNATFHCRLCRFAIRCSEIHFFQVAAAKLMTDLIRHGYAKERLQNKLHNSRKTFFKNSPIKPTNKRVHDPVVREKYWWLVTEGVWKCIEREGQAPGHDRLLSDEWVRLCTSHGFYE